MENTLLPQTPLEQAKFDSLPNDVKRRRQNHYEAYKRHCQRMQKLILDNVEPNMLARRAAESHQKYMEEIS